MHIHVIGVLYHCWNTTQQWKGIVPPPTWMDLKNHILNHVVLSEKSVLKGHTVCFHLHNILRITKPWGWQVGSWLLGVRMAEQDRSENAYKERCKGHPGVMGQRCVLLAVAATRDKWATSSHCCCLTWTWPLVMDGEQGETGARRLRASFCSFCNFLWN